MAYLRKCDYCGAHTIQSPCQCVVAFGEDVNKKIAAFRLVFGYKRPLPRSIQRAMKDKKWSEYVVHTKRENDHASRLKKISKRMRELATEFAEKAQKVLDAEFGEGEFKVGRVSIPFSEEPQY